MKWFVVKQAPSLIGEVLLPGDKSIAHRLIILSAICRGKTIIENFPTNQDCLYTLSAFKKFGIRITLKHLDSLPKSIGVTVFGKGLQGLRRPKGAVFVGDSGTTMRLLLGVLAGQNFKVRLTAGKSLSQRPMLRVTQPLRMMGAIIKAKVKSKKAKVEEYPPITISGGDLCAIAYRMPVASAQVKSAILCAGLYARGITRVIEPLRTRDHTERILRLFKVDIKLQQNKIVIKGGRELVSSGRFYIPGDISSASFFIVAATILPNSRILIKNVSLNPSRAGIIKVLRRMGADINIKAQSAKAGKAQNYEPMGNLLVKSSSLRGTRVKRSEIPSLIDELPILMVAACLAKGKTIIEGVGELRVKEADRIKSMSENLIKMGADVKVAKAKRSENIVIRGVKELVGARIKSFGDHRTAMSLVVAGLRAKGKTFIDDMTCINKSFPDFLRILYTLT